MFYLDNAATTRIHPEVSNVVNEYNNSLFFNPSSVYSCGVQTRKDVEKAIIISPFSFQNKKNESISER